LQPDPPAIDVGGATALRATGGAQRDIIVLAGATSRSFELHE
jgi:hypothetical protein